jgi:perosamine synthetase
MMVNPANFIDALRDVIGPTDSPVSLHEPTFAGNEWNYVKQCIDTGWVSSVGKFVDEFERRLAEICGVERAVAVVNGTAALHICLLVVGVRPGDEVIIPALTFVATANAVSHAGAIPHLVDSDHATLGLDPAKLDRYLDEIVDSGRSGCINRLTGRRIGAIMPMHTFGHPVDMDAVSSVASRFGIPVVEDATEAVGSAYKGRPAGSLGSVAALSFNGNKTITTGGGGALLTNDPELGRIAKHLTTTAKTPHAWDFHHDAVAYNYRLPNINAALGCAQLENLPDLLARKRVLAERYAVRFSELHGLNFIAEPAFARSNFWLNGIILDRDYASDRNKILEATNNAGLMTRPCWIPMHRLPMYRDCPQMELSQVDDLVARIINIPSSPKLVAHA